MKIKLDILQLYSIYFRYFQNHISYPCIINYWLCISYNTDVTCQPPSENIIILFWSNKRNYKKLWIRFLWGREGGTCLNIKVIYQLYQGPLLWCSEQKWSPHSSVSSWEFFLQVFKIRNISKDLLHLSYSPLGQHPPVV